MLEPVGPPSFVPLLSAGLTQLCTPIAENSFLESLEIAMLFIVWVCEPPRELATNDPRLVKVWADDGEGKEW